MPDEWADKYRGRFEQGWDEIREETLVRQKELGVISVDRELSARAAEIPAWEQVPADLKPVLVRQMEIYAGFLEHTDHHVGRLVDALEELEVLDDTLVFVIIGDNGASAEGSLQGTSNEYVTLSGFGHLETPSSWPHASPTSAARRPTTTTPSAGLTPWTRRTNGPSRSRRTSAAPATARPCTGPRTSVPR